MKKKYLYCIFLVLLAFHVESQPLLKSRKLHGLNPVVLGEGNVNAISYAEGIIFFATQLGVELYYNNQIIATFTYLELTGKASNSRYEQVELYADVDRHCMFVKDNKGSGKINYFESRCDSITGLSWKKDTCYFSGANVVNGGKKYSLPGIQDTTTLKCVVHNGFKSSGSSQVFLVGTSDRGLLQYYFKDRKCIRIDTLEITITGQVPLKHIMSLRYLPEFGTVVIGTCGQGAFLWSQRREKVFKPIENSLKGDQDFRSFAHVGDRHLLAGNDKGGIALYDVQPDGAKLLDILNITDENHPARIMAMISEVNVNHLYSFYVATDKGQLSVITVDIKKGRFRRDIKRLNQMPGEQINCLITTQDHALLIGTQKGLWAYGRKDIAINGFTVAFFQQRRGAIYFGGDKGIRCLKPRSKPEISERVTGLPNADFSNIIFCNGDTVILCTRDSFIFLGTLANNHFQKIRQFTDKDGFAYRLRDQGGLVYPTYTIYGGFYDRGIVWLSSNFGIHGLDLHRYPQVPLYYYKTATGLGSAEFNTNAMLRWNDRLLIFGSRQGWILMDIYEAMNCHYEKHLEAVRLWQIEDITRLDKPFRYQKPRISLVEGLLNIPFDDKNRQFMPVLADYSLLETILLSVVNEGQDTFLMSSGRIVGPEYLLGQISQYRLLPKINTLQFKPIEGQKKIKAVDYCLMQHPSDFRYQLLVGLIILLVIIVILLRWQIHQKRERQKEKTHEQEEQRKEKARQAEDQQRRELFIQLGKKLAKAEDYSGIHDALQLTGVAKDILSSTKISIFIHDAEQGLLRCVAHSDSKPRQGEPDVFKFDQLFGFTYSLTDEKDSARPAVWLWKHQKKEDSLIVNNASTEFYGRIGIQRPKPLFGNAAESFIFELIGANGNPTGIIGMQNEKEGAYSGDNAQKYREWLNIIKYFVELALGKIASQEEVRKKERMEGIRAKALDLFGTIVNKRLNNHITKDFMDCIADLHPDAREITEDFRAFITNVYTTKPFTFANNEIGLINSYEHFGKLLYKRHSIKVEYIGKDILNQWPLPAFLLFNAVNNAAKYAKEAQVKVEIAAKRKDETLIVAIRDSGPGLDIDKYVERRSQDSSTQMIETFFQEVSALTPYRMTVEVNDRQPKEGVSGVCVTYSFPIPLLEQFEEITKKYDTRHSN